jgi:hypothetical protein
LYIGVQFGPNIVALETPPSFSITVPSSVILPGASYWLAAYDPTQPSLGWQLAFEGPAAIATGSSTLNFSGGGLYDFAGGSSNNTYWFALYAASSSLPPPTPAPTNQPVSFGCTNQPFDAGRRTLSTGPRPLATGDTSSYGGANSTLTQTIARGQPCPEPTATAVASVSDAVTVAATTAPSGAAAWDAQSIESDAFATNTVTTTTDSIVNEDATHEFTYGNTITDENGDTIQTRYNSPQTVDELPEGSGHSWSINPAGTVNETLTDNTSIARTYAADGSYQETDQLAGATTTINERADGSGSYTIGSLGTLTVSAPSAGTITLAIGAGSITIPAWFTTPVTVYGDTFADNGPQSSPSWCQPAVTATNPDQIVETLAITDPVLGYTENRTTTYYDSQTYGTVCMQILDTLNEYYDYLQDTPISPGVFVSGNASPLQTNTISEFYVMNSTPTINAIARRSGAGGVSALARSKAGAIDSIRAMQRMQRMRNLQRYIRRSETGGRSS